MWSAAPFHQLYSAATTYHICSHLCFLRILELLSQMLLDEDLVLGLRRDLVY